MIGQLVLPPTSLRWGNHPVTIRPLTEGDRDTMRAFGLALAQDHWLYLEDDFRSPELMARLINAHAAENWRQIVAEADGTIIGYSAVRRLTGWSSHVADIQLIVSDGYRHNGLSDALAPAIFAAACDLGVTKVIVGMLAEQTAGQALFERLGFCLEGTLSGHARDRRGQPHDLLILARHIG
jgi:RimJ/RimL family protein N-acetyltransferase